MMNKATDLNNAQVVLRHLKLHGHISPLEALLTYGILRLAPRICELREEGYPIATTRAYDAEGKAYTRYERDFDIARAAA